MGRAVTKPGDRWTPEEDELVLSMWKAGKSFSTISVALDRGCTSQAVAGRVNRLGMLKIDRPSAHQYKVRVTELREFAPTHTRLEIAAHFGCHPVYVCIICRKHDISYIGKRAFVSRKRRAQTPAGLPFTPSPAYLRLAEFDPLLRATKRGEA